MAEVARRKVFVVVLVIVEKARMIDGMEGKRIWLLVIYSRGEKAIWKM